jgi:hypothetical protein
MQLKFLLAASAASVSLACGIAAPVHAQETTSTISGTVTSGGAPVAGATVEVLNTATGATSTITTSGSGSFSASGLRPGDSYTVTVNAPGYESTQVTDVVTQVAQSFNLPIDLAAQGGEAIVVTASRLPGAGSISQGPVTALSAEDIEKVASINRDIRDLSRRDPFARLDDTPGGGRAVSFAGQNARFNKFSVDGISVSDNFGLNPDGLPSRRSPIPFDAIGQFQARVAPFDVREGNFQGGAVNIVLKSGTNAFHGTGFYAYLSDELVGKETKPGPGIPTGKTDVPNFKLQNYGVEIDGPIIKDKLFFMVAGERLRGGRPIPEGPTDDNAGTAIPNLTTALVNQVSAIAQSVYSYDTGGVQRSLNDKDDRVVAKLDANISDTQRLAATYTYAKDGITLLNNTFSNINTGSPGLGLASNAYTQGNRLHTGVLQLNSEWSDEFSTEVRAFHKDYVRIQDPLLGRGFAQFRVCTNAVSGGSPTGCENVGIPAGQGTAAVVSFGPDNSRQTNALTSKTWGGLVQARLTRNDHDVRVFAEYQDVNIFNSFLQNSAGNFYFDSIADFQNRAASSITYGNAIPSLVPEDAAAKFSYQSYVFGVMDSWRLSPDFTVNFGARYDLYGMEDRPALSAPFQNRYSTERFVGGEQRFIGPNTANINGLGLFQPRFGFNWNASDRFSLRGGGGIFGGGTPDVYISNSFSNTGVLTNTISFNRTATGFNGFPGGTPVATQTAVGNAALVGVTGTSIPGAVNDFLRNATVATNSTVNALDPDFKIPSQWRATLSADYEADLGALGDGWRFGADVLVSKVRNQVFFTDIRSQPLVGANAFTPDGRQRYFNLNDALTATGFNQTAGATSTNTNTDILLTNTKKGRAYIGILRFEKDWDFGLTAFGSYTYQDVKDRAPATSSTAGSNYSNGAFIDPNNVAYGRSNDEVRHFFKYGLSYDHAFFGDYETSIGLFGETRIGHPFSYTFQDFGSGRSAVFGVTGRSTATSTAGNRYLLYVPTGTSDPLVSYSDAAFATAFNNFVDASGLKKYRGGIAPRNAFNSKWFTKLDLHLSQELPTGFGKSRIKLFADVENFTNLIDKDWGQVREYVFPYNVAVAQVQCLTTTGNANGAGTVAANVSQPCAQYRYSPLGGTTAFTTPVDQVYVNQSLYAIRIGARFTF